MSFFWLSRLAFIIFNISFSHNLTVLDFILTYYHGFMLDLSMLAYIMVFPFLILLISTWLKNKFTYYFINVYTAILLFVFCFLIIVDIQLYGYWQFRLDATPLLYLNTPKEMLASISTLEVIYLSIVLIITFILSFYIYIKSLSKSIINFNKTKWYNAALFFILMPTLIIPIRGGIGIIPLNVASVYFHNNIFANHNAINVVWNVGNSLINYKQVEKINFYPEKDVNNIMYELHQNNKDNISVINISKPNILLIILESFTGDVIKEISGKEGITPNISKIIHEGMFFNNYYASGDRTDKALVALLSGYPALPTNAIVNYPDKTQKLPYLTKSLKSIGYTSTYIYGGDINFANIKSYLINGDIDKIISKDDFNSSLDNSKWGVYDEYVFDKTLEITDKSKNPFINIVMTLSSHNPYDVPYKSQFNENNDESKFYNSISYTDKCLGDFINKAKTKNWWKNTLVIITADHGKSVTDNIPVYAFQKYNIPMIWTGGAVSKKDTVVSTICSQTDLLNTILSQISNNSNNYQFSKNIFEMNPKSFAFYVFNNGFGFVSDSTKQIYSNSSHKFIISEGEINDKQVDKGKSYFQYLMNDFKKK